MRRKEGRKVCSDKAKLKSTSEARHLRSGCSRFLSFFLQREEALSHENRLSHNHAIVNPMGYLGVPARVLRIRPRVPLKPRGGDEVLAAPPCLSRGAASRSAYIKTNQPNQLTHSLTPQPTDLDSPLVAMDPQS